MRDYPHMQKNYARARELMARNGNPTQWGDTFPKDDVVRDDIAQRRAMLLVDEVGGHERILAQFALCPGEDPTYHHIDGAWLDDDSYVTIHRIASSGLVKHAARDCIAWALKHYGNVRAATHPNDKDRIPASRVVTPGTKQRRVACVAPQSPNMLPLAGAVARSETEGGLMHYCP